ncbi:MAG TPA: FAD-dependent oxidoreductase [Dehalococcoidales bacterium]|nr:FAD-dependent oxidoreductase [Dehalococcoidales bacterium]
MAKSLNKKTIREPAREVRVCYEADVVVVGGGPGGHSAAIAAARNGARTVLLERYGHLGGMATGGIVIQIPHMSDGGKEPVIAGLTQEWLERLDVIGGALRPRMEEIGSDDKKLVSWWRRFMGNVINGRIEHTAWVDPELLKCVLNDMVEEAGVKLFLHSWGTRAIVNDGKVQGIVFESKSGRQAILGEIIIDGTGDGDLLPSAGAECDGAIDPSSRSSMLALVFRLGNCDYQKLCDFREAEPAKFQELMKELAGVAGTRLLPLPSPRNDVLWVNNWIPGLDCTNVEDLTRLEVEMRKIMLRGHAFLKKNVPTFENSFILDTASQTGTRGSRRLAGEYVITKEDFQTCRKYEDTIAVFPRLGPPGGGEVRHVYIPYRALVPVKTEGLLVAGRSFSSDMAANNMANLIPHCIAMGQAAGTAAALAIKQGISPRKVNYTTLQKTLMNQGVPLPGVVLNDAKQAA